MTRLLLHSVAKGHNSLACLTRILALYVGLALPIDAGAQQPQVTCTFLSPDGTRAVACATVVTAKISWAVNSSPTEIQLTVPNTFKYTGNLNPNVLPGISGAINNVTLDSCALRRYIFNITTQQSNPLFLDFKYMGCTDASNCTANTQHLFFDCAYRLLGDTVLHPASITMQGTSLLGLNHINNQMARATHATDHALLLSDQSNLLNSQGVFTSTGNTLDTLVRQFKLNVSSLAIDTVQLHFVPEPDATHIDFQIKKPSGVLD
jgi:hypothetical protein